MLTPFYHVRVRQMIGDFIFPEGKERREQLSRELDVDALTGVANTRALDRALPAAEADQGVAVIAFDANNFGQVNKLRGQQVGDWMLKEIASVLTVVALAYSSSARVFRRGGDEFVVLTSVDAAEAIREHAETLFGHYFLDRVTGVRVVVSISGTIGQTFDDADRKLQARKREQKGSSAAISYQLSAISCQLSA